MKLCKPFKPSLVGQHGVPPRGHIRLQLTGEPPASDAERLVGKIIGEGRAAPLRWLEEQICDALYRTELRRSASVLDIGIWGPALFAPEAARILEKIRPEFAYLVPDNETGTKDDTG